MNKVLPLSILLYLAHQVTLAQPIQQQINPAQLKPAVLLWDYGTLEIIYPSQDSSGTYWNAVHQSQEPFKPDADYDYYKVNAKTLQPIVSEMFHKEFIDYRIDFLSNRADIVINGTADSTRYSVPLPEFVAPEGPGSPLFWGSLPLKTNFEVSYSELDRWAGSNNQKAVLVKRMLKVVGEDVLIIDQTEIPTYKLNITSDRGSNLAVWVMKKAPHYWLKVIYRPTNGQEMVSTVSKIFMLH